MRTRFAHGGRQPAEAAKLELVDPISGVGTIGAGFVIATVVRTAINFASVPAEMPGSAAALNEASLGLGGRLGIVFSTSVATQVALQLYGNTLGGLPTAEAEQRLAALREL